MSYGDALKNVRNKDYGDDEKEKEEGPSSVRIIKLTDDEMKELQQYQGGPGQEQTCEVTGKLEEDGHFHVMSVHLPGGGGMTDEDAAKVAGVEPRMVNMQTQPSPS
jgi:hypothetical protein